MTDSKMIDVGLSRIVLQDGTDRQYIVLSEPEGRRRFPIVIGSNEAQEIHRLVHGVEAPRPLTHQLAHAAIEALGAKLQTVDIVDLRQNTYFAHLVLESDSRDEMTVVDARPSDAIALALRARCPIRVAESVLERAAADSRDEDSNPEQEPPSPSPPESDDD